MLRGCDSCSAGAVDRWGVRYDYGCHRAGHATQRCSSAHPGAHHEGTDGFRHRETPRCSDGHPDAHHGCTDGSPPHGCTDGSRHRAQRGAAGDQANARRCGRRTRDADDVRRDRLGRRGHNGAARAHRDRGRYVHAGHPMVRGRMGKIPGWSLRRDVRNSKIGQCGARHRRAAGVPSFEMYPHPGDRVHLMSVVLLPSRCGVRWTSHERDLDQTLLWRSVPHQRRDGGRGWKKALDNSTSNGTVGFECARPASCERATARSTTPPPVSARVVKPRESPDCQSWKVSASPRRRPLPSLPYATPCPNGSWVVPQ